MSTSTSAGIIHTCVTKNSKQASRWKIKKIRDQKTKKRY